MKKYLQVSSIRIGRSGMLLLICLLALCLTACGSLTNNAKVLITAPPTGYTAGEVTISVDIKGFTLVDVNERPNDFSKGHIIYYMDIPVPTYYDHSAKSISGTYSITDQNSYTWENVTPGVHTFGVQLVKGDDTPLPSAAVDSITLEVKAPVSAPEIQIITPAESTLPPGNIIMTLKVNNFIVSKNDMGVINRKGEGHLIYYIDEDPPVAAGIPAVTDTTTVTPDLRHVWKAVSAGAHTFSVQLVNNDDTPLSPPVFKTVKLTVGP